MHERVCFFHFFGRRVTAAAAAAVLCLCALAGSAAAQEQRPKDGRYYETLARKAYQEKDYASFLANMKAAAELRPNHPRLMFNLAAAYSLNGQGGEALKWLARLADMGLVFPAAADDDFVSIRNSDQFKAILQRVERNKARVGGARRPSPCPRRGSSRKASPTTPRRGRSTSAASTNGRS